MAERRGLLGNRIWRDRMLFLLSLLLLVVVVFGYDAYTTRQEVEFRARTAVKSESERLARALDVRADGARNSLETAAIAVAASMRDGGEGVTRELLVRLLAKTPFTCIAYVSPDGGGTVHGCEDSSHGIDGLHVGDAPDADGAGSMIGFRVPIAVNGDARGMLVGRLDIRRQMQGVLEAPLAGGHLTSVLCDDAGNVMASKRLLISRNPSGGDIGDEFWGAEGKGQESLESLLASKVLVGGDAHLLASRMLARFGELLLYEDEEGLGIACSAYVPSIGWTAHCIASSNDHNMAVGKVHIKLIKTVLLVILVMLLFLAYLLYMEGLYRGEIESRNLELEALARRDAMSGLGSRYAYSLHVEAIGHEKLVGVCFADANGLKFLNDSMGHKEGDRLIEAVGAALIRHFGAPFSFRTGGDEFVAFAPVEEIETRARALHDEIWSGEGVRPIASIGWAVGRPQEAIALAEAQMYEEKRRFYALFPEMDTRGKRGFGASCQLGGRE